MLRGILISGKMLSGKDHVATHIIEWGTSRGIRVRRFGWADRLKVHASLMLSDLFGRDISVEDIERDKVLYRPFLQGLGQTARRVDPDFWVKIGLAHIEREATLDKIVRMSPVLWVNTDTRMPNELALTKNGFISIRLMVSMENQLKRMLSRDGRVDEASLYHETETALDEIEHRTLLVKEGLQATPGPVFDYILEDMDLEDVYKEIDRILEDRVLPAMREV